MTQVMEWMAQRKSKDKGESEEATVGIESDGRRKEIAVEITPRLKSRGFYFTMVQFNLMTDLQISHNCIRYKLLSNL